MLSIYRLALEEAYGLLFETSDDLLMEKEQSSLLAASLRGVWNPSLSLEHCRYLGVMKIIHAMGICLLCPIRVQGHV